MRRTRTVLFPIILMMLAAAMDGAPRPQYRAFWIETFRTPLATHRDIDRVVDAALQANANALFVQVRRRADSWYLETAEPLTETPGVGEPAPETGTWTFDPFRYLIEQAHAHAIEVHAFVIVGSIYRGDPTAPNGLPRDKQHVFLQHIWDAANNAPYRGARQWATRSLPHNPGNTTFNGQRYGTEWYIDLGHPQAAAYTVEVLMKLVDDYDIDGLHLDRIRYPEAPIDRGGGANVGYNETSVARFKARFGDRATLDANGWPRTNDPLWSQWRRDQVTAFVRRLYLNAIAHKPQLRVSAALIAFGSGPRASGGFAQTEAYWGVFQDWQTWAREGILDIVTPMTYKREHVAVERAQFDDWVNFTTELARTSGRLSMPGIGAYLNPVEGTLRQARRAGDSADGIIFFAVGDTTPNSTAANSTNAAMKHNPFARGAATPKRPNADFFAALRRGTTADGAHRFELASLRPIFAEGAPPPVMAWKSAPAAGHVMGFARDPNGAARDGASILIESLEGGMKRMVTTDGGGFFGAVGLPPGNYRIDGCTFRILAGSVARIDVPCPGAAETAE
jgi:uncharacterized lipoprotein YddW (UPF0748 family)